MASAENTDTKQINTDKNKTGLSNQTWYSIAALTPLLLYSIYKKKKAICLPKKKK